MVGECSDFYTRRAFICYYLYKTPRHRDIINKTVDYVIKSDIIIK